MYLTRAGDTFRLAFAFDRRLLELVKQLPYATFSPGTRAWSTAVCAQSVHALRRLYYDGLTDVSVDSLLEPGEEPAPCKQATLRAGTKRRPFVASIAMREDGTYDKLTSISGAQWDKKSQSVTFPPHASVALAELVARDILEDPDKLLSPADTVVAFDTRTGLFTVRGSDERAAKAFERYFPGVDVVSTWRERGLDVAFADPFTEEVYRGELARVAPLRAPEGMTVELFDYQKRNVAIAMERTGFAILDEPGLGKTIQAIATGAGLLAQGAVPRVCVLVPATVRSQWAAEIVRFTGTSPDNVVVVRGDPESRARAYAAAADSQWFVVHYDILAKDLKQLSPLFSGAFVVADEGHRLKSYKSARTTAALQLCRSAARRLALSGTPLETSVAEWYQVMSGFAVPGCLGNPKDFYTRYRYPNKFGYEGARNLGELRQRSRVHYSRHTKAEVAQHLPPLRVEQLILDPDPPLAAALRRAHREAADEIEKYNAAQRGTGPERITGGLFSTGEDEEDEKVGGSEMNATGQLRLMCSSPRLVHRSSSEAAAALVGAGLIPDIDGPKLDELRVMAADFRALSDARKMNAPDGHVPAPEEVQSERFVVFTFSKSMANLIAERFAEDGIPYVLFTGDVSADGRDEAVAKFTDPSTDVLAFIATDAAAEGLNLGRCCSTLIQFDPPWTPSRSQQRVNRIHRIDGTATKYLVINMVVANTLEVGVYRLLGDRADVQDGVLGESNTRYKATGRRSRGRTVFEEAMADFTTEQPAGGRASRRTPPKKAPAVPVSQDGPRASLPPGRTVPDVPVPRAPEDLAEENGQLLLFA